MTPRLICVLGRGESRLPSLLEKGPCLPAGLHLFWRGPLNQAVCCGWLCRGAISLILICLFVVSGGCWASVICFTLKIQRKRNLSYTSGLLPLDLGGRSAVVPGKVYCHGPLHASCSPCLGLGGWWVQAQPLSLSWGRGGG